MFRRTGRRAAVHPDGYEVREHLPGFAEYREGDHVLRFGGEVTGRKSAYDIILYPPRSWQPPFETEALPSDRLATVIERVTAGLQVLGIRPLWSKS